MLILFKILSVLRWITFNQIRVFNMQHLINRFVDNENFINIKLIYSTYIITSFAKVN